MIYLIRCFKTIIMEAINFLNGNKYLEFRTSVADVKKTFELLKPFNVGFNLLRIGGNNDGAYLIPNDLEGIEMCISPGYGHEAGFEEHLYREYKIKSIVLDQLPEPENLSKSLTYVRKYIGLENNLDYVTLENIVNNLNTSISNADLLLQMDIEGSEYLSVLNTPQSILDKFRIIVIELHYLERVNNIFWVEQIMIPFLRKITLNHTICHTHPNNSVSFFNFNGIEFPRVIEITLLRNDRFKKEFRTPAILPNALDQPNKPQYTELYFDFNSLNKL